MFCFSSAAQSEAYYGSETAEQPAVIDVRVPADAVIKFEGQKTTQTGAARRFHSKDFRRWDFSIALESKDFLIEVG